jgi:gamma-glutamylcyclotransferase (GGCT)/AIG2-like uncharacterized protein YtfP
MSKKDVQPIISISTNDLGIKNILVSLPPPKDDSRVLMFFYGTLRRGEHNCYLLRRSEAVFIGEATLCNAIMFTKKGLGYPYLRHPVYDNVDIYVHELPIVSGEIWAVKTSALSRIDALEGYNPTRSPENNHYNRVITTVTMEDFHVGVYTYVCGPNILSQLKLNPIESGDWLSFTHSKRTKRGLIV